jgi:tetratricopeptide (TPR) repeat protein
LFVITALVAGGYLLVQTRLGNGIQLGRNVRTPTPAPVATATRSVEDFLRLADDATARGDYRAAIDFYDKASRRRPNDPEPHRKAARLLVFINQPVKAEQRARKALEIDSNHLPSRAVLCMAMEWQKRIADAIAECQAVVAADPTYATGQAYLAEALADSGDFASARSTAQTAVDLEPDNADALRNLAYVYDVFGQYDTALYHYQRTLERSPNLPHVLTAIGRIYFVTGQTANAIKTLKRVVEMDPQNADAFLQIGRVYRFIGERGQAMEALDRAVELDPLNVRPLTERALLNFQMRDYFGSVDDYTRALTTSQQVSGTLTAIDYLYYGFAYRWIQECDKARDMWSKSLELAPTDEEIQGNIAVGLEACQRLQR